MKGEVVVVAVVLVWVFMMGFSALWWMCFRLYEDMIAHTNQMMASFQEMARDIATFQHHVDQALVELEVRVRLTQPHPRRAQSPAETSSVSTDKSGISGYTTDKSGISGYSDDNMEQHHAEIQTEIRYDTDGSLSAAGMRVRSQISDSAPSCDALRGSSGGLIDAFDSDPDLVCSQIGMSHSTQPHTRGSHDMHQMLGHEEGNEGKDRHSTAFRKRRVKKSKNLRPRRNTVAAAGTGPNSV
jgi:hypothetical protein